MFPSLNDLQVLVEPKLHNYSEFTFDICMEHTNFSVLTFEMGRNAREVLLVVSSKDDGVEMNRYYHYIEESKSTANLTDEDDIDGGLVRRNELKLVHKCLSSDDISRIDLSFRMKPNFYSHIKCSSIKTIILRSHLMYFRLDVE